MNKHYTFQEYLEKFSSIQDSYEYYFEQQKELDRLNNIINELENYLEENILKLHNITGKNFTSVGQHIYQEISDKLKELKGEYFNE